MSWLAQHIISMQQPGGSPGVMDRDCYTMLQVFEDLGARL